MIFRQLTQKAAPAAVSAAPAAGQSKESARPVAVSQTQWAILAGVRFFLAFAVVCQHLSSFAENRLTHFFIVFAGFPAVAAFLLISGFSIAASCQRETSGFFRRRFFRIYPVYAVALLLSLVPFLLTKHLTDGTDSVVSPLPIDVVGNLLMTRPLLPWNLVFAGPLWSVQIEWAFYLFAPYLVKASSRLLWFVIGASAIFYWCFPFWNSVGLFSASYGLSFAAMVWLWLLGWQMYHLRQSKWVGLAAVLLVCLCFIHWQGDPHFGIWRVAPILLTGGAIVGASRLKTLPRSVIRVLEWLGDVSYDVYVVHYPILALLFNLRHPKTVYPYLVAVALGGVGLLYLVDKPLRRLGRR